MKRLGNQLRDVYLIKDEYLTLVGASVPIYPATGKEDLILRTR